MWLQINLIKCPVPNLHLTLQWITISTDKFLGTIWNCPIAVLHSTDRKFKKLYYLMKNVTLWELLFFKAININQLRIKLTLTRSHGKMSTSYNCNNYRHSYAYYWSKLMEKKSSMTIITEFHALPASCI